MTFLRWLTGTAALLSAGICLHAQDVPAGWKVIKDSRNHCQFAVPADWVGDPLSKSFQMSPDHKASAVASSAASGSFAEVTGTAKQLMIPKQTIENSAKRLWYVYTTEIDAQQGKTDWYVAVPTTPVCAMQIDFKGDSFTDTVRKIALSLTQAK